MEDIINSVVGRDPEQLRPPTGLSWDPLIELLDREGIVVTEDELIAQLRLAAPGSPEGAQQNP